MRFTLIIASAAALFLAANNPLAAATQQASDAAVAAVAPTPAPATQDVQQPPRGGNVDITIGETDGTTTVWYANPVWIAIGLMAVVVVGLLIGMVARGGGGGDTIVK